MVRMLHNVLTIIIFTVLAFTFSNILWLARRNSYPERTDWWQAEGIPVFIAVWFVVMVILLAVGGLKTL